MNNMYSSVDYDKNLIIPHVFLLLSAINTYKFTI